MYISNVQSVYCVFITNTQILYKNKVVKNHIFQLSWLMAVVEFEMAGNAKLASIKLTCYQYLHTTVKPSKE